MDSRRLIALAEARDLPSSFDNLSSMTRPTVSEARRAPQRGIPSAGEALWPLKCAAAAEGPSVGRPIRPLPYDAAARREHDGSE